MNSDSLNMVSRLGEGHMPGSFFLSEPQLKTTVGRDFSDSENSSRRLFHCTTACCTAEKAR